MDRLLEIENLSFFNIASDSEIGILFTCCNTIDCTFYTGLNILYGSIDDGGWSMSSALIDHKSVISRFDLMEIEFRLDHQSVEIEYINQKTQNLGIPCKYKRIFTVPHFTVGKAIDQALKESNNGYTVSDILELFGLEKSILTKKIKDTGNLRYRCNAAIGFAAEKVIFSFPWISERQLDLFYHEIISLSDTLKRFEKIILLPCKARFPHLPIVDFTVDSSDYTY